VKKLTLSKSQLIRSTEDFGRLFQKGQRYSSPWYLILVLNSNEPRFGVAVSGKTNGAVKRNRARRKTKEILRVNQSLLPANKEFIAMAKPGVERQRQKILAQDLLALLQKVTRMQ
jgi:ribonuclease P protein component